MHRASSRVDVWVPLATWLVVAVLVAAAIVYGLSAERARLQSSFELRTELLAEQLADGIRSRQELLAARATDLLAGESVEVSDVRTVVTGLGFESGAVFDDRGRYITSLTFREEAVGQDFTDALEHVRIAAVEGRPGTSQVVISPGLGTAAIGLSTPYATPYGTRLVTGVLTLQGGILDDLVDAYPTLETVRADLLDRDGNVIASHNRTLSGSEVVAYDEMDPTAAAALATTPTGTYEHPDGRTHVYHAVDIDGTDWRLLVASDQSDVFANLIAERRTAWAFYGASALLGLLMAGAAIRHLRGRRQAERAARDANTGLEEKVELRTTELRQALEQARAGERAARRHTAVVDSASEAIVGLDLDGTITSWNVAAEALYGYDKREVIGASISVLADPEDPDQPMMLLRKVIGGETVSHRPTVRRSEDGQRRAVEVSIAPIHDEEGTVVGAVSLHLDVAERLRSQKLEQAAAAFFESMFRTGAPQALVTMEGRVRDVNQAFCDMLGRDREELLQISVAELTHPADRAVTRDYYRELRDGVRRTVQQTKRYVHADGHTVHGLLHLTRVSEPAGDGEVLVALIQDVTALIRTQEQLAQREAMLEGVTSSSANIATMYDSAGRCVFAAGAGLAGIGETRDSMVGTYFVERHGGDAKMLDAFRRALSGEAVDLVAGFGDLVHDVRFRPVGGNGAQAGVALAVTDVTERERARQEIQRSARRFRALVQHAKDAILQLGADGTVLEASPGVVDLTGLDADQVIGRSLLDFVVTEDRPATRAELHRLERGAAVQGMLGMAHISGQVRQLEYDAVDLREDDAVGTLVVTLRDVTERERLALARAEHAAELKAINAELEGALRIREDILSATTHELRTPLTPMVGLLELMRSRFDDLTPDVMREYIEVLHRNTGRLTALVEDLLFATQLRGGHVLAVPEPLAVRPAIDRALQQFPRTRGATVAGSEPIVWCDPNHLDQILTALLSNAARHAEPPYTVESRVVGRNATIAVVDAGPGIPAAEVEGLFELFVQGSSGDTRTATRLGLGLPIARALAEANGGHLVHRSNATGGSTFVLTLLLAPLDDSNPSERTDVASS